MKTRLLKKLRNQARQQYVIKTLVKLNAGNVITKYGVFTKHSVPFNSEFIFDNPTDANKRLLKMIDDDVVLNCALMRAEARIKDIK